MDVKGKAEPIRAWRLVGIADNRPGRGHSGAQLVGRAPQLSALESSFEAVATMGCGCRLVTVVGPAGIGKSRLVDELIERLGDRARVARGRCLPYGTLTFWPLAEVVRDLTGLGVDASPEETAAAIASLLPASDDAVVGRVAAAIGVGDVHSSVPEETFAAVRQLLDRAAREGLPLIVVFDDVHWGERTFLDLVEYLPRLTSDAPVLILCTARGDLLEARPEWSSGELVELEPLDGAAIGAILTDVAGGVAPPAPVIERLHTAAGGNPLFAEEMLRMLLDEAALERQNGGWRLRRDLDSVPMPPTINALLAARLERLPAEQRSVLERAAVIGRDFSMPVLAELCDGVDRDVVSALVRSGVIRAHDSAGITYGFAHLMMRDVAYQALPKSLRGDLHERLADRGAAFIGERDEVIGYHLEQAHGYRRELGASGAALEGLGTRAATRLAAAGRRANARGDLPTAVDLLRRAEALLPDLDPDRLALLPELGEALCDLGDLAGAEAVLVGGCQRRAPGGRPARRDERRPRARIRDQLQRSGAGARAAALAGRGGDLAVRRARRRGRAGARVAGARDRARGRVPVAGRGGGAPPRALARARGGGARPRAAGAVGARVRALLRPGAGGRRRSPRSRTRSCRARAGSRSPRARCWACSAACCRCRGASTRRGSCTGAGTRSSRRWDRPCRWPRAR